MRGALLLCLCLVVDPLVLAGEESHRERHVARVGAARGAGCLRCVSELVKECPAGGLDYGITAFEHPFFLLALLQSCW